MAASAVLAPRSRPGQSGATATTRLPLGPSSSITRMRWVQVSASPAIRGSRFEHHPHAFRSEFEPYAHLLAPGSSITHVRWVQVSASPEIRGSRFEDYPYA